VKAHIPFASPPENIVFASESYCGIDSIFKLNSCICKNRKIGIGCSTVHIPWITEKICSTPQKLHPCLILQFFHHRNIFFEALLNIEDSSVVSDNINIVETIIGGSYFSCKLKSSIEPAADLVIELHLIPWEEMCGAAKLIGTITTE